MKERYEKPECIILGEDNPYPLCIGIGRAECEDCQLRAGWEPEDPYGVGE